MSKPNEKEFESTKQLVEETQNKIKEIKEKHAEELKEAEAKEAVEGAYQESKELTGEVAKTVLFVDEHGYVKKAIYILTNVGNLRLVGETGTGKTTLVYALRQKMGASLYETVLTNDTSRWDLLACDVLKEGKTETRDGIVLQWLKDKNPNGSILFIDGWNYGNNGVVSLFESLGDFRGNVYVPELGQTFYRTSKHYLVIAYNPVEKSGYTGTFIQNIATIRRFEGFNVDYLSITEETKVVKNSIKDTKNCYEFARKFVEIANKTRKLYREAKLRTPLTTGNLINYAKMWKAGLSEDEIIEIAKSLFPEDEQSMFARLYEDSSKLDLKSLKEADKNEK